MDSRPRGGNIGGSSLNAAVGRLEGKHRRYDLAWSFFALIFEHRAHINLQLTHCRQDTDTEDTATATAGIDRRSFSAAVRKLEGETSSTLGV